MTRSAPPNLRDTPRKRREAERSVTRSASRITGTGTRRLACHRTPLRVRMAA
jgi:hypothetical protein